MHRVYYIIFIFLLFGCSNLQELDIWPIVYYEKDKEKKETTLDIMGPIYSYRDNPKETTHAFRPFFIGEFPKDKEFMQMLFLWPLGLMRQKPNDTKIWVLPFYYYRNIKRPEVGERDFDWFFLPFFCFGGTDTKEGAYLYVTLWGNIKGLLGYDEISITPFPFYVKAKNGKYVTRGYMWPFFRFGEGGGKKFSFYCFVYSSYEMEGKFKRKSYLWPIVHYNKEYLHKKHPVTEFVVFPFYGQAKSDVSVSRSFLWPFFSYAYNKKSGYKEYNIPWPFFKYRKDKGVDEFRIWPFYWTIDKKLTDVDNEKDLIVMWPFFWHSFSDYSTFQKESTYVLPFYWSHWKKNKSKNSIENKRVKVWPFCSYQKKENGTTTYKALSPLWFEDYLPYGIQKAWLPFFTIFNYSYSEKGTKDFTLLGPIYQYKKNKEKLYHRFLVFSYKKVKNEKKDNSRYSFLGGLFEYSWNKGEKSVKLFYIPMFSWGKQKQEKIYERFSFYKRSKLSRGSKETLQK